jgi:cell division protein FtsL
VARVRWDRLGRLAMLFVLAALLYLYLSAGVHMLSTWKQARHDSATVVAMEREHRSLVREHESLGRQGTVEAEARRLNMKKTDERQFVVTGLPAN